MDTQTTQVRSAGLSSNHGYTRPASGLRAVWEGNEDRTGVKEIMLMLAIFSYGALHDKAAGMLQRPEQEQPPGRDI